MANVISQLTTANTFNHWLIASQQLIATANLLTEGNGSTFYANTKLEIGGSASQLNVTTSAGINTLWANTVTAGNIRITGNVTETLNISSDTNIGGNLAVSGDTTITGNLTVSGNLTLDTIGFDDLSVSGSGVFGNNLVVLGNTSIGGDTTISGNLNVSGNINLDEIGFNDLNVSGTANVSNNLFVYGTTNLTGNVTSQNVEVQQVLTANVFAGNANTQIYNSITQTQADSLAFAIALG